MLTNRYSKIFTGLLIVVVAFMSVDIVARPASFAENRLGAAHSVSNTYLPLPPGKQTQLYNAARDARHIYHGRSSRELLASIAAYPDYFQRHPELSAPSILGLDASDYFQRHPELSVKAVSAVDLSDYYFRQLIN